MITRDRLKPFVINRNIRIIEAFHKIDQNKKGFLIIVDKEGVVLSRDINRWKYSKSFY